MVNTEEIVERTFYICLLQTALKKGLTLNPEDYLPLSQENERRFQADKDAMPKFIPIYGIGNNQVKGAKTCPRITIELQGFYNGDIGVNKYTIGDKLESGNYQASEFPYETKDITLDIHLVSNTQADMRLLHNIMYEALPSRGYVRPYYNNLEEWEDGRVAPTGNLFIEIGIRFRCCFRYWSGCCRKYSFTQETSAWYGESNSFPYGTGCTRIRGKIQQ